MLLRSVIEQRHYRDLPISEIAYSTFLNLRIDSSSEDMEGLALSIRKHGLLQPLIVRESKNIDRLNSNSKYELVCGHRRLKALSQLSIGSASCVIMNLSDQEALEIALTENIQRHSLDAIEEAEAFKLYITSFGRGSVSRLAAKIGKSESYVSHRLLLLGLPKVIQDRICRRLLKCGEATELLWIKDQTKQTELADQIIVKDLSFREVRTAVGLIKQRDIPASEAVREVLSARKTRIHLEKKGAEGFESNSGEARNDYVKACQTKQESIRPLERAILSVRTSLSGMDLIIEENIDGGLKNFLMNQRAKIHEVLDELIREKVALSRNKSTLN